jgi:hypothetical protein
VFFPFPGPVSLVSTQHLIPRVLFVLIVQKAILPFCRYIGTFSIFAVGPFCRANAEEKSFAHKPTNYYISRKNPENGEDFD